MLNDGGVMPGLILGMSLTCMSMCSYCCSLWPLVLVWWFAGSGLVAAGSGPGSSLVYRHRYPTHVDWPFGCVSTHSHIGPLNRSADTLPADMSTVQFIDNNKELLLPNSKKVFRNDVMHFVDQLFCYRRHDTKNVIFHQRNKTTSTTPDDGLGFHATRDASLVSNDLPGNGDHRPKGGGPLRAGGWPSFKPRPAGGFTATKK